MNRRHAPLLATALLGLLSISRPSLAQPAAEPTLSATTDSREAATAPASAVLDQSDALTAPKSPAVAAAVVATRSAPDPAIDSTEPAPGTARKERPVPHLIATEIGLRMTYIVHEGFDPYAEKNGYGQVSLAGAYTFWQGTPISVAAGAEWNFGVARAEARGDATALTIHRLAASLQVRYAPVRRLSMFAKLAPAALHIRGDIEDIELSQTLEARTWTWALDATGGAALLLGSAGRDDRPSASFWFSVELGYSFAGEVEMMYRPDSDEDEVRHFGDVRLPNIRPSGFLNRFAFGVSF